MNIQQYLNRIHYQGALTPSLAVLKALQKHHLLHIPFENLDIHHHTTITLDLDRIAQKVLFSKRGGFCYELNGLFFELLQTLGFEVKRIAARVFSPEKGYGPEFDHLAIIANVNHQEYLVDVGFGAFTFQPLRIQLDEIQKDEMGYFRIEQHNDTHLRVSKLENEAWTPSYIFTKTARAFSDYAAMCHYQQTSPDSHFTKNYICSLARIDGRTSLSKDKLTITTRGEKKEIPLPDELAFYQALSKHFGIHLPQQSH
ncbi:MAG: arylamine N-acetyltransferase family protein [Flammeovirgaceae bacterium]